MAFDEEVAWAKSLTEAVGGAQARNTVHHYILRDLVIQFAKAQPEPEKFVSNMFERVSRLLDEGEIESQKTHIDAEMRWVAESFFTRAGEAVRK
jgi:hypothetical protein